MRKRIASAVVALALCLSLLPATALAAEPDERRSIQLGTNAINGWSEDDGYDYIYLGTWEKEPVKWRVLSSVGVDYDRNHYYRYGSRANSYATLTKDKVMVLLSEEVLGTTKYSASSSSDSYTRWGNSLAKTWCTNFANEAFSAEESDALAAVYRYDDIGSFSISDGTTTYNYRKSTSYFPRFEKVYFPFASDATNEAYGFGDAEARKADSTWWLFTTTSARVSNSSINNRFAAGTIDAATGEVTPADLTVEKGARPITSLNKVQVVFAAAADNRAHEDGLSEVESYDGHDFKLTLKDENSFAADAEVIGGRTTLNNQYSDASITVSHQALSDISEDYTNVTAALADSDGNIIYYGSVNDDEDATSTVIALPDGLENDEYTLYLYGETWNDAYESDVATGTPFTTMITIHDGPNGPDLTPREQNGLMNIGDIDEFDQQWGYNYIYFGEFNGEPLKWRVLSQSGNATGAADTLLKDGNEVSNGDAMFLLSEYLLDYGDGKGLVFNANGTAYQGSDAQAACNALLTFFTEQERNVMLDTTKSDALSANGNGLGFAAVENILNGDKLFLPSVDEMKNEDYGFFSEADLIAYYGKTPGDWWMRSPGINGSSSVADAEYNTAKTEYKIYAKLANEHSYGRPAFNLSKNDVLFISSAAGIKDVETDAELGEIKANMKSEWKLTLRDDSRDFDVAEDTAERFAGGDLTLNYTGATIGEDEYISAIMYNEDGEAIYYGHLKELTSEDEAAGEVELIIPEDVEEGSYTICLFNEHCNDSKQTDYASDFCEIALTVDNTDPELSEFEVSRADETTASITFNASETGTYYYVVTDSEDEPEIDMTGEGTALIAGEQTLNLDGLSSGKSYLHIIARDVAGNESEAQTVTILGYLRAPGNVDWDVEETGRAVWDAVENASGYRVQLYRNGEAVGDPVTVNDEEYVFVISDSEDSEDDTLPDNAITETGAYSFSVLALGDGENYANSIATESARHLSSITVEDSEHGTAAASAGYAVAGAEVTLTGEPDVGYRLNEWVISPEITVKDNKFVMPDEAVTVSGVFVWRQTGSDAYIITINDGKNGSTTGPKASSKGATVTITVDPDEGYTLETITVTDKNGNELELTDKGNGKYSFIMPASNVAVRTTFMDDNSMLNFFVDVKANDYYYNAVLWAAENGITTGTDAVHFSPNLPCTRAQIVTFLWRSMGSPVVNYAMSFSDVPENAYYAEAVRWAVSEGITTGTTETTFSPDEPCTRVQAIAFLFRCAAPDAVTLQELVSGYADAEAVPGYALGAMNWALASGILQGDGRNLTPNEACTRAQIVTFLYRTYNGR